MKKFLFLLSIFTLLLSVWVKPARAYTQVGCPLGNYVFENGDIQQTSQGVFQECVISATTGSARWQNDTQYIRQCQAAGNCATRGAGLQTNQFIGYGKSYPFESFKYDFAAATGDKQASNLGGTVATIAFDNACTLTIFIKASHCAIPPGASQAYIQELNQSGALAGIGKYIGTMYDNRPADLAYWIRDTGQTLGFIPKSAYAQGIGFTGLTPLLPIWKAFRNIAYMLMAVVLLIVGFMVMLRKKIDPKTVVTVQNALPKIVITLLLITFSYAIAGLMIDLMYLVIAFSIALLSGAFPNSSTISMFGIKPDLINGGFVDLLWAIFAPLVNNSGPTGDAATAAKLASQGQWGQIALNTVLGVGLAMVTAGGSVLTGVLIELLMAVAFLFAFVRIFLMLLSAYIQIILAVIVGPIQILMDAIPGGDGFASWLKNLFLNIVPFPITIFLLILGNAIAGGDIQGKLWQPPFLPQVGGGVGGFAVTIIWLGLIFAIPSAVGSIKEIIKSKVFINAGPGAILGPIGAGSGQIMQLAYQASFLKSAWTHGPQQPSTPLQRQTDAAKSDVGGLLSQVSSGGSGGSKH